MVYWQYLTELALHRTIVTRTLGIGKSARNLVPTVGLGMKESVTLKSHDKKVPNEPNKSEMGWCKTNYVARLAISGVYGVNVENLQVFVHGG